MLRLRLCEPLRYEVCGYRADIRYKRQLVGACGHQLIQIREVRGEDFCCFLPDLTDTERADEPRETCFLALLNGRYEIGGRLFAHAVKLDELFGIEIV